MHVHLERWDTLPMHITLRNHQIRRAAARTVSQGKTAGALCEVWQSKGGAACCSRGLAPLAESHRVAGQTQLQTDT